MSIESVLGKIPIIVRTNVKDIEKAIERREASSVNNGFYVNIEGIDGSGKSELVAALGEMKFADQSGAMSDPITLRQPGGSVYAESIRDICRQAKVDNFTQTLVYGSSLHDALTTTVLPCLRGGATVIADRGFNTLFAYQGLYGRCSSLIIAILQEMQNYRAPDLTIYLSLPLSVSLERTGANRADQENDRYSQQKLEQKRTLKAYYDLLHGLEPEAKEVLTNEQYQTAKISIHNYLALDQRVRWDQALPKPVIIDATLPREEVLKQAAAAISTARAQKK